jgi:hypothetical protein
MTMPIATKIAITPQITLTIFLVRLWKRKLIIRMEYNPSDNRLKINDSFQVDYGSRD